MSDFKLELFREQNGSNPETQAVTGNHHSPGVFLPDHNRIVFHAPGLSFKARISEPLSETIWLEPGNTPEMGSFVVVFGWCYRMDQDAVSLSKSSVAEILQQHRDKGCPALDGLSGIYCIISFDHISQTLWICSDLWACHSFFYGANSQKLTAAGRAGTVAECLGAEFDAYSCLGRLRGCGFAAGKTLFAGVLRATPGKAIKIDLKSQKASLIQVQEVRQETQNISRDEAVERLADFFKKRMVSAASLPGMAIDLTGGTDSRTTIAALAAPEGVRIGKKAAYKFSGPADSPDAIMAKKIAGICGFDFRRHDDRMDEADLPMELVPEAINALGGAGLPDPSIIAWLIDKKYWHQRRFLIGSSAGEVLRNQPWKHELFRLGLTTKVNFRALLKHRLYAASDVNLERTFANRLSFEQHDAHLLYPLKEAGQLASGMTNVYVLDLIYQFKRGMTVYVWENSDYRITMLPYLISEVANFVMTLPWTMRNGRSFQTSIIERLAPELTKLPSDQGAPMKPLRPGTAPLYLRALSRDAHYGFKKFFMPKKLVPRHQIKVPAFIKEYAFSGSAAQDMFDAKAILKAVEGAGANMSMPLYKEMQLLALVNMLCEVHPGIPHVLSFSNHQAHVSMEDKIL